MQSYELVNLINKGTFSDFYSIKEKNEKYIQSILYLNQFIKRLKVCFLFLN